MLDDPVITEIAAAHNRTPGQIVLRWHVELGNVVFPKSMTPSRIEENIDIFDFELSAGGGGADRGPGPGHAHRPGPRHVQRLSAASPSSLSASASGVPGGAL